MRFVRRLLTGLTLVAAGVFGTIRLTAEGEPPAAEPDPAARVTVVDSLWTADGWTVDRTIDDPFEPTVSTAP